MKIFYAENNVDYSSYTFSYAIYALRENSEDLSPFYEKGFLPYSGNDNLSKEVFYLARSLRVDLDRFQDTSENRRVNRLVEPLEISFEAIKKSDFDLNDKDFKAFCETYINERIGMDVMNPKRWDYILNSPIGTHILKFSSAGKTLGYVLGSKTNRLFHYWFSMFDTAYLKSHSLGKWMMWKSICWAKEAGLKQVYLGTAYKPGALYKIRDHKGLEFWDGKGWNQDVKLLKRFCQTDLETKSADRFKTMEDPNHFLNEL